MKTLMTKFMATILLGVSAAAVALPSSAFASLANISIVGAGDFSTPSGTDTYTSKFGVGGGLLLGFPIAMRTEIEIGGLYIMRKTTDTTLGEEIDSKSIQVPVVLRYHLIPGLSIGVGGYAAFGTGDLTVAGADETYSNANIKTTDYGILGSVALRLPVTMSTGILVDGRYEYGLNNVSQVGGVTTKYRDVQVLVGLEFSLRGMSGRYH